MPASPDAPTDVLAVDGLKTYYYRDGAFIRAVDDVGFRVPPRARVGMLGASGSGKTQTALSVMGLIDGTPGIVAGHVRIEGADLLRDLPDYVDVRADDGRLRVEKDTARWRRVQEARFARVRGRQVGMVFQEPVSTLSPYFTVAGHLRETVTAHFGKEAGARVEDRAGPLLDRLGFRDARDVLGKYPHQLSGGESQRVMLALALVGEPRLLIADEPTTLIDAHTQVRVMHLLTSLLDERDLALLMISHDLAVLSLMTDYVLVMVAGRLVEAGPREALLAEGDAPRHPYTSRQLGASLHPLSGLPAGEPVVVTPEVDDGPRGCCYRHACALKGRLSDEVQRRCDREQPPLVQVGEAHTVACWAMEGAS